MSERDSCYAMRFEIAVAICRGPTGNFGRRLEDACATPLVYTGLAKRWVCLLAWSREDTIECPGAKLSMTPGPE